MTKENKKVEEKVENKEKKTEKKVEKKFEKKESKVLCVITDAFVQGYGVRGDRVKLDKEYAQKVKWAKVL